MEQQYELSPEIDAKCVQWGKDYSEWLSALPERTTLSYRNIEKHPGRLAEAKRGECVFAMRQGWLPAVNFNVQRGPDKADIIVHWRSSIDDLSYIECRTTSTFGSLLLYPINKWRFFEERRIDYFVLIKMAPTQDRAGRFLVPQGFCKGWCTKDFFRTNHVIASGKIDRERGIDKGTPYVLEEQLEPMETFPVPQDYQLVIGLPRRRLV